METVYTKEELTECLKAGKAALVKSTYAEEIRKNYEKRRKKKMGLVAGAALVVAGLAAAPFTGGMSLGGTAAGAAAMGLTIGTLTMSTAELAIICGTILAREGIFQRCKVTFNSNGSVTIEPTT